MITCPAIVPTVEDESPEASSEMAKIDARAPAEQRLQRRYASSMMSIVGQAVAREKVEAAMISMAALTKPARPIAMTTSTSSKRKRRSALLGRRGPRCGSASAPNAGR